MLAIWLEQGFDITSLISLACGQFVHSVTRFATYCEKGLVPPLKESQHASSLIFKSRVNNNHWSEFLWWAGKQIISDSLNSRVSSAPDFSISSMKILRLTFCENVLMALCEDKVMRRRWRREISRRHRKGMPLLEEDIPITSCEILGSLRALHSILRICKSQHVRQVCLPHV